MNLLLINYEYPPIGAGAATASQQIARALRQQGHGAVVLTSGFEKLRGASDENGVRVLRVASWRRRRESSSVWEMASFMAMAGPAVREIVSRERIDGIIAFFSIPGGPLAWWAWRASGVPYVVSLRGGDVPGTEPGLQLMHRLLAVFRRHILRHAQKVVANSAGLRALSMAADPVPVIVIPNGVDTTFFQPPAASHSEPATFRFLFVGRFQAQKNLPWLLREIAVFARESSSSFTLDLVGDGPLSPSLHVLATELGLESQLNWHGWVDRSELRQLYQSASAVLNPSLYEGMPNVLLEAMACGLPVIASAVAGNSSVVQTGETGHLFPLNDGPAFRSALARLVGDRAHARQLGEAGRRFVAAHFSWNRVAQSYLELFPPGI